MPEGVNSTHKTYETVGGDLVLLWTSERGEVKRQITVRNCPADTVLDVRERFYVTDNVVTAIARFRRWLDARKLTYQET